MSHPTKSKPFPSARAPRSARGFSLIEVLTVVAIIGILASIAIPQYNDYLLRGKVAEAFTQLTTLQNRMEQYYLDNRNYGTDPNCGIAPPAGAAVKYFGYACVLTNAGQGFTYTATGTADTTGFVYTVNEAGVKGTTTVGAGWTGAGSACWVRSKGGGC